MFFLIIAFAFAQEAKDLMELSLEELLNIEVTTATKTAVKLSDVPAALTVITKQDIQKYGYRNLAEALARVPEVYMHYQGHNHGVDFRGFYVNNNPRRVLLLINGHRANDRFHFGDFEADIINDLSDVERIEIIRGPGAALYGSVAVLGVVNIITKDPAKLGKKTSVLVSTIQDDIATNSLVGKYQFSLLHNFDNGNNLAFNLYLYDGKSLYDTKTGKTARPWNPDGGNKSEIDVVNYNDFFFDAKNAVESGKGLKVPSYNLNVKLGEFTLGSYLHSRATTWVWPKDTWTWNNENNIRSWGTFAAYVLWQPQGELEKYDINLKFSYNLNSNREIADFSTTQYVRNADGRYNTSKSLFEARMAAGRFDGILLDNYGNYYNYKDRFTNPYFSKYLTKAYADQNGGGAEFRYAGLDKSYGLEFQMTPYKSDMLNISFGGNYENAVYANYQGHFFRNNKLIGWNSGIIDRGYYMGSWLQVIFDPIKDLTVIAGARYDYQNIVQVYRHLGGEILYRKVGNDTVKFMFSEKLAKDFTPRIALNYRFSEDFNLRLIYSQAFRAVPPQEIIRLPATFTGSAESEKTYDYEAILNYNPIKELNLQLSGFYLKGNVVYQWNPAEMAFSKGSGWNNTGVSFAATYIKDNLEAWFNTTYYQLKRSSDAYAFMRDYKTSSNPALPNMEMALGSPTLLAKLGGSYSLPSQTTFAAEFYYNNEIKILTPVNLNVGDPNPIDPGQPNYLEYKVPASYYLNLAITQRFEFVNLNNLLLSLKVRNVLDSEVWNVLNMDMQGFDRNTYYKPNQIPDFGRRITLQLTYEF